MVNDVWLPWANRNVFILSLDEDFHILNVSHLVSSFFLVRQKVIIGQLETFPCLIAALHLTLSGVRQRNKAFGEAQ